MIAFSLLALIWALVSVGITVIVGFAVFRLIYWIYTKMREDGGWHW